MAYKKYTITLGRGHGSKNISKLEKCARDFWNTLADIEKKTWFDQRISNLDQTGEDTFISFIVQKYTSNNLTHYNTAIKKVTIADPSKKTFQDRKSQSLQVE